METDFVRTADHRVLVAQNRRIALGRVLSERLGEYQTDLELTRHRITFAGERGRIVARADLIAAVSAESMTFRWGWSPQLARAFDGLEVPRDILEHGVRHHLPSLAAAELPCTAAPGESRVEALARAAEGAGRIAIEVFGAGALYVVVPFGKHTFVSVLVRDLPVALPELRLETIMRQLSTVGLSTVDPAWVLDGLAAESPGWAVHTGLGPEGEELITVTGDDGCVAEVRPTRLEDELVDLSRIRLRYAPEPVGPGAARRSQGGVMGTLRRLIHGHGHGYGHGEGNGNGNGNGNGEGNGNGDTRTRSAAEAGTDDEEIRFPEDCEFVSSDDTEARLAHQDDWSPSDPPALGVRAGRRTDLDLVIHTLDTEEWVFIRPDREIHDQDEVHDEAARRLRAGSLPPSTAYAGWHHQQHSFTADGALELAQFVYWGGDAAAVKSQLDKLAPLGFLVLGGRSSGEPFTLAKNVPPVSSADSGDLDRIRARLLLVGVGRIRDSGGPLPTHDDLALCHDLIAAADAGRLPGDLLEIATETLHDADELYGEEIAIAHRAGKASARVLASWEDPRGPSALRDGFVSGSGGDLPAYVRLCEQQGEDPERVLMDVAQQVRRTDYAGAGDHRIASILHRLVTRRGDPLAGILDVIADHDLPLWFREGAAHYGKGIYLSAREEGEADDEPIGPERRAAWERFLREWPAAADEVHSELGVETQGGLTVREQIAERWIRRELSHLEEHEAELLRADLCDPDTGEPELAIILEQLLTTGALRLQDLSPLHRGWRKRLLRPPDVYSSSRPAVVSMVDVLLRAGDPLGEKIAAAVMRDRRRWTSFHKLAIEGARAELGDDDAMTRLAIDAPGSPKGAIVHVRALAARRGADTSLVAAELWTATSPAPRYRQLHYGWAAIALRAAPHQPDWGISTVHIDRRQHRDAALELAADERLPADLRDWMRSTAEAWAP